MGRIGGKAGAVLFFGLCASYYQAQSLSGNCSGARYPAELKSKVSRWWLWWGEAARGCPLWVILSFCIRYLLSETGRNTFECPVLPRI